MVYCVCCGGSSATRGADGINPTSKTAWAMNRLKKDVGYYTQQQEKFYQYLNVNKFFTVLEMSDAVTRTISLLTMDVKTQKIIGVNRETTEEALRSLKIGPKKLNAMWDILLATEEEVKQLAGRILTAKTIFRQCICTLCECLLSNKHYHWGFCPSGDKIPKKFFRHP